MRLNGDAAHTHTCLAQTIHILETKTIIVICIQIHYIVDKALLVDHQLVHIENNFGAHTNTHLRTQTATTSDNAIRIRNEMTWLAKNAIHLTATTTKTIAHMITSVTHSLTHTRSTSILIFTHRNFPMLYYENYF